MPSEGGLTNLELRPLPAVLEPKHDIAGRDELPLANGYLGDDPRHLGAEVDALRAGLDNTGSGHRAGELPAHGCDRGELLLWHLMRVGEVPKERAEAEHAEEGKDEGADHDLGRGLGV